MSFVAPVAAFAIEESLATVTVTHPAPVPELS